MNQNPVAQESKLIRMMIKGEFKLITVTQYKTDTGETYWQYRHGQKIIVEKSKFGPSVLSKIIEKNSFPSYSQK